MIGSATDIDVPSSATIRFKTAKATKVRYKRFVGLKLDTVLVGWFGEDGQESLTGKLDLSVEGFGPGRLESRDLGEVVITTQFGNSKILAIAKHQMTKT